MRRRALVLAIGAVAVVAAGFTVGRVTASHSANQVVVQGRVTGADGRPVSGIKVWLNALTGTGTAGTRYAGPVTIAGSAVTSATGTYAIRVQAPASLAPDAANGVVTFSLMAGNSTGWDAPVFTRDLVTTAGGFGETALTVPPGGSLTTNLHLTPQGG
jgi:hypothetical protein